MQNFTLPKSLFIFILVASFLIFEMAIQVSPGVITRQLMDDLRLSPLQLGWMSGSYFFTYTIMQIPAGLLYDRFSTRYVIIFPLFVCASGVFLFGLASNFWLASLARILMGCGSAFAFIGVLVVAADVFPNRYFALLAGIAQKLAAFGAMGGQIPMLYLVDKLGWRHTMFLLTAIGILLAILIYLFVKYKKCPSMLTNKTHTSIIFSLKQILGNKQTWLIAIYACCMWAPMAGFASLWGVPYLVRAYSLTHEKAAIAISIMWLGLALASPILGLISDLLKQRKIPLLICGLLSFICFSIVLTPMICHILWIYILLFITGATCSGQALSFALVRDQTAAPYQAAAIGFNNMAVVIAGAIFQPLVGQFIAMHAGINVANPSLYSASDFQFGLITIAAASFIAFVLATFFIKDKSITLNAQ